MLCYLDRTFCNSDCMNEDCFRNFTKELQEKSKLWWSHDPENVPVALSDFSDGCSGYTQRDEVD